MEILIRSHYFQYAGGLRNCTLPLHSETDTSDQSRGRCARLSQCVGPSCYSKRCFLFSSSDIEASPNKYCIFIIKSHCCPVKIPDDYYKV